MVTAGKIAVVMVTNAPRILNLHVLNFARVLVTIVI